MVKEAGEKELPLLEGGIGDDYSLFYLMVLRGEKWHHFDVS